MCSSVMRLGSLLTVKKKTVLSKIVNALEFRAVLDRFVDKISMEDMPYIKVPTANYQFHYLDTSLEYEEIANDLRDRRAAAIANQFKPSVEGVPKDSVMAVFSGGRSASINPVFYGGRNAKVNIEERSFNPADDKVEWTIQYVTKSRKLTAMLASLSLLTSWGLLAYPKGR